MELKKIIELQNSISNKQKSSLTDEEFFGIISQTYEINGETFKGIPGSPEYLESTQNLLIFLSGGLHDVFQNEREKGSLNKRIYSMNHSETKDKELIVIGDIHGDIQSMNTILKKENFFSCKNKIFIFLGDYIDRGPYQPHALLGVMLLKYFFPNKVFLLRGNHEYFNKIEQDNGNIDFTPNVEGEEELFLNFWKQYFNNKTFQAIYNFFEDMPFLFIIPEYFLFVHGGVPRPDNNGRFPNIKNIDDLNDDKIIYHMVWSDAENKPVVDISGEARFVYAFRDFYIFMEKLGLHIMIRSHQQCNEGYEIFDKFLNRYITIFSTGCCPEEECSNTYYSSVNSPAYAVIKENKTILIKGIYDPPDNEVKKKLYLLWDNKGHLRVVDKIFSHVIYFLIDFTESMKSYSDRIEEIFSVVEEVMDKLDIKNMYPSLNFKIVPFGDTDDEEDCKVILDYPFVNNKTELIKQFKNTEYFHGKSPLEEVGCALQKLLESMPDADDSNSNKPKRLVFVFTDSYSFGKRFDYEKIVELLKNKGVNLSIFAPMPEESSNEVFKKFLKLPSVIFCPVGYKDEDGVTFCDFNKEDIEHIIFSKIRSLYKS